MMCPICQKTELTGRQTYCSPACRKKASRLEKVEPSKDHHRSDPVPIPEAFSTKIEETPQQWLARRVKETQSDGWQWLKTGVPPGSSPDVKVPKKWELTDIDQAMAFRGQWEKRVDKPLGLPEN